MKPSVPCVPYMHYYTKPSHPSHVQAHVTSTVSHAVMCRGDTLRALRIADFFAGEARTKPKKVQTLTFACRRSKTNKTGNLEYMMMTRHKLAERCPVGNVYVWIHWWLDITKIGE